MIEIIDGWFYEADESQYTLIHEYQKEMTEFGTGQKTGEIRTIQEVIGYYTSIASMIIKLSKLLALERIRNGEIKTIEQHITALREIKEQLENTILPF